MPGTPIKKMMIANIQKMGGVEELIAMIAGGETIGSVAKKVGVSRPFLSGYLHSQPHWSAAVEQAKKARASAWADEALQIADGTPPDPNEINLSKMRIETRKWLAGIDNPEEYGSKGTKVEINIGTLHLDALRKRREDGSVTLEGESGDGGE